MTNANPTDLGAAAGMTAGSSATNRKRSRKLATDGQADPAIEAAERKAKAGRLADIAANEPEPIEAEPEPDTAAEGETDTDTPQAETTAHNIHVRIPEFLAGPDGEPMPYVAAPTLAELGNWLIENKPVLKHLRGKPIAYLFKRQGGKSAGVPVWGSASVASGKLKYALHATFIVELAADHCQAAQVADVQYEKLLFHELMHLGIKVDDRTEEETPTIRAHDVEAFAEEIAEYGAWRSELGTMRDLFQQTRIDFGGNPVSFRGRM